MCEDGLGRCMSITVYIIMLLGQLVYFLAIVKPVLDSGDDAEKQDTFIEYGSYSVFWLLMLFSHIFTMCVDPGFIPKAYSYD